MSLFFLCARECIECDIDINILPSSIQRDIENELQKCKVKTDVATFETTTYQYNGKIFGDMHVRGKVKFQYREGEYSNHICLVPYKEGVPLNNYTIYFGDSVYNVRLIGNTTRVVQKSDGGHTFYIMLINSRIEPVDGMSITGFEHVMGAEYFLEIGKNVFTLKANGIFRQYRWGNLYMYYSEDDYRKYNRYGQLIECIKRMGDNVHIVRYHGNSRLHMHVIYNEQVAALDVTMYNMDGEPYPPINYMPMPEDSLPYYGVYFSSYTERSGEWSTMR